MLTAKGSLEDKIEGPEEDSKEPRYIITVIKIGYKFGGDN